MGKFVKGIVIVVLGIIIALALRGRVVGMVLPLIIAYVGASCVRPAARLLSKACHISERVGGAVLAAVICGGVIYLISVLSVRLTHQLWRLAEELPGYGEDISSVIRRLYSYFPDKWGDTGSGADEILERMIGEAAGSLGAAVAGFLGSAVQSLPRMLMGTLVSAVGFIHLTADMDGAARSIESLLPPAHCKRIRAVFLDISGAVFSYLRAYATILTVNFFLLSAGLSLIGVNNPLGAGAMIALVDALPLFGCGTVIIPWSVICFLGGEMVKGASLLILLGVIYIVRQLLEPRVIGKMTGVHPFIALAAVYIGLKLGGIGGMIAAPIGLMCIRAGTKRK